MADDVDEYFAKAKRERRWIALHEDGQMFGLVPAEEAEFSRLCVEFGDPASRQKDQAHD